MFGSVAKDMERGVEKVRWFAKTLSERAAIECSAIRLLYRAEELKKQRDKLLKTIGREVFAMRGKEQNVYANLEIMNAMREIETLDAEIRETSDKVSEMGKTTQ